MFKFKIKNLLLFTILVFIMFPTFVIPFGSRYIPVAFAFFIFSSIVFWVKYNKFIYKNVLIFLRSKYTHPLLLFAGWIIFSDLIFILLRKITIAKVLSSVILGLFFSMGVMLFMGFLFSRVYNLKTIAKTIYGSIYALNILGFINFSIFTFNISFLGSIYFFFVNKRLLVSNSEFLISNMLNRVQSTFEEPSHYVWFLCINLPLIYEMSCCKYKIFDNQFLDKFVKFTSIPLAWFCIIATLSPIGIIIGFIVTIGYYVVKNKKSIKRLLSYFGLFAILSVIFIIFVLNSSDSNPVFYRIKTVLFVLNDFKTFVIVEGSLATRLIYYSNAFIIALHNPIFGVGWGNLGGALYKIIEHTNMPLTLEVQTGLRLCTNPSTFVYTPSIFFRVIAETGFIGAFLFYYFLYRLFNVSKKLAMFADLNFITCNFMSGLSFMIISFFYNSFYNSILYCSYFWIVFGILIGIAHKYCRKCK